MPQQNNEINNLVDVQTIDKLTAVIREGGANVLFNFGFLNDDVTKCAVEVHFAPVEQNDSLNAIANEFGAVMKELMPELMTGIYRKLAAEGLLDLSSAETSCEGCDESDCPKHPLNQPDENTAGTTH